MTRRSILLATTTVFAALAAAPSASAQTKPLSEGITIVIPLNAIGSSREASVSAMKAIAAVVRKQPGLIDDVVMEHRNPANKPSHVHVMRWKEMKNWEAVHGDPEFQKVLQANKATVQVQDGAGVYTPIK
jgi:quinol monooxygenase YgiN